MDLYKLLSSMFSVSKWLYAAYFSFYNARKHSPQARAILKWTSEPEWLKSAVLKWMQRQRRVKDQQGSEVLLVKASDIVSSAHAPVWP